MDSLTACFRYCGSSDDLRDGHHQGIHLSREYLQVNRISVPGLVQSWHFNHPRPEGPMVCI